MGLPATGSSSRRSGDGTKNAEIAFLLHLTLQPASVYLHPSRELYMRLLSGTFLIKVSLGLTRGPQF